MRRLNLLCILILAPFHTAFAEKVCVEEVGGVCLKFQDVRQVSPAEAAENQLGLTAADRRAAQAGLAAEGYYTGGVDGALGPQSRGAIRNWQSSRGEAATGYLTAGQIAALRSAAQASALTPAAPAESTQDVETAPATETAAAPTEQAAHPQPGRIYSDGHVTLQGVRADMTVERVDDANVRITLRMEDDQVLEDSCIQPIDAEVACYMRRARWNMILVSGRLPRLVASETEAMPQVKIRADKEVFEFW